MTDPIFISLLYVHVLFVVVWLGSALFGEFVFFPLLPRLGDQARVELTRVLGQRALRYSSFAGTIALVDGLALYLYINFVNVAYATSAAGLPFIQLGALLGIAVQVITVQYSGRMVRRMQAMQRITIAGASRTEDGLPDGDSPRGRDDSTNARLSTIGRRVATIRRIGAIVLVIVLALMVVGSNI